MNSNADLIVTDMLLAIHGASPNWLRLETTPRRAHGLIFVKTGQAEYRFTDGHSFVVKPGDLFFLPKFSRYQGRQVGDTVYSFVYADFETADPGDIASLGLPDVCPAHDPAHVLDLFSRMASCWLAREPGYKMVCRSLLLRLIAGMLREQSAAALPQRKARQLEPALEMMRKRLGDASLRMEELAAGSYLSPGQFRRVFREVYGCSPSDYLTALRIEHACDLLRAETWSASQTAEECGFTSLYYFSRVFKARKGVPPSRYRRDSLDI